MKSIYDMPTLYNYYKKIIDKNGDCYNYACGSVDVIDYVLMFYKKEK